MFSRQEKVKRLLTKEEEVAFVKDEDGVDTLAATVEMLRSQVLFKENNARARRLRCYGNREQNGRSSHIQPFEAISCVRSGNVSFTCVRRSSAHSFPGIFARSGRRRLP